MKSITHCCCVQSQHIKKGPVGVWQTCEITWVHQRRKKDYQSKVQSISLLESPQTCYCANNHSFSIGERSRKHAIFIYPPPGLIGIIINTIYWAGSSKPLRVKQDKTFGQAELTGCPFMSSVEKHWLVVSPPCQSQKTLDVNFSYVVLIYKQYR